MADQPTTPLVEIASRTDPGRDPDKQVNEDAAAHADVALGLLAVVCDGMGGHAGGKEASELAVKTILEIMRAATEKTPPGEALRFAIEEANQRVWSMPTSEGGHRPGSTVVAILAHERGVEIAHVGDSRIYLVHSGAITQVTKDHSMVQEMVDRNIIKQEEAANHPDANKIMRALGIAKEVAVDLRPEPLVYVAGDVFILCSDGLSDLVNPSELLDIAGSRPPAQAAGQLVDLANARGGHDNITALLVRMKGSAAASEAATIVKTIPQTAHAPVATVPLAEPGAGRGATVLTEPLRTDSSAHLLAAPVAGGPPATVLTAPLAPAAPVAVAASARHEPAAGPASLRGERSRAPMIAGILLGLIALAIAVAFVWTQQRPTHMPVPVVPPFEFLPQSSEDAAAAVAPDITLAPVLAPPSGVKVPWWKDPDAAPPTGEPRECAMARWQRDAGRPSASLEALEAKCRAAGGRL